MINCIDEFKKSSIKANKDALIENERLKQIDLFSTIKRNIISNDTITILVHNVRSLSKHVNDILNDRRIINNDIIRFTETQISLSDSTCRIVKTLNFFNLNFNNSEDKFLSLANGCRNVAVLDKLHANGVSIFSFKNHAFADRVFNLMLVYRKHSMQMQEFFQMFQYLLATNPVASPGDFNFDLLKVSENNLFINHFPDHRK